MAKLALNKSSLHRQSGLLKTLKKDGILILNTDDEAVIEMKSKVKNRVITYGMKEEADLTGSGGSIAYDKEGKPAGIIFRVDSGGTSLPVSIGGVLGGNYLYSTLATLALASGMKWNVLSLSERFKNYDLSPGRMRILPGIKNTTLIDDTYNSSPAAAKSALKTLKKINTSGRRIAILGDMLELGKWTVAAHREIGKLARFRRCALGGGPESRGYKTRSH